MNWTKTKPTRGGWYFWRSQENQSDPFYWLAYFFCAVPDQTGRVSWWSDGMEVQQPKGGEYCEIRLSNTKAEKSACSGELDAEEKAVEFQQLFFPGARKLTRTVVRFSFAQGYRSAQKEEDEAHEKAKEWRNDFCDRSDLFAIFNTMNDQEVKEQYAQEDWGKLLIALGYGPHDTESSARRVAEKAAELLRDIYKSSEVVGGQEDIRRKLKSLFDGHED